jgi:2-(1,2-epoxy-1,2-dihydrophenyl)acetyl-CoA isomerase
MTYSNLDLTISRQIARIVINRPEVYNAVSLETAKELCDVANRLGGDRSVRVIMLTGAGDKAFSAGGDVATFAQDPETVGLLLKEITGYLHMAIARLAWGNAPVLGVVNGVAAGGGLSLVAACDLVIAADSATFTSAFTKIGLVPDGSVSYFLPRIIGIRRAAELFICNRVLTAAEALDWGLVNRVVPRADLATAAEAWALDLASGPTQAYGGIKRLLLHSLTESLESQMEHETREIVSMAIGSDGREGVRAFVEKRKPRFAGQ